MIQLILASASAGRKHILNQLDIPFSIVPTDIDEDTIQESTPLATIQKRARMKAETALERISNKPINQFPIKSNSYVILSADTEVVFDNKLIGKPKDHDDAVRIFQMLSGKTHEVITAINLWVIPPSGTRQDPHIMSDYDQSYVTFRKMNQTDIERYLSHTDFQKYTAGYAVVASAQDFIVKVEGSISNVIGLPLEKLIPILQENRLLPP